MFKFVVDRVENIVGKGENASYQHFLLFPQCSQKASFLGLLKVGILWYRDSSLPKDIFLDWSKLKALADDEINVNENLKFVLGRVEEIVGKENAGYQHFLLFPQCFQMSFFKGGQKLGLCGTGLNCLI